MEQNKFIYYWKGKKYNSVESWIEFVNTCLTAPVNELIHLQYENLLSNPNEIIEYLCTQIGVKLKKCSFPQNAIFFQRTMTQQINHAIIDTNRKLGYT